jgi:probable HAF family extracellular repeat protein
MNKIMLIFIGYLFSNQVLAVNYSFTDLGTLGGSFSFATSISNSGHVVGQSALSRDTNYGNFIWEHGTMSALPNNFYGTPVVNNLGIVGGQGIVDYPSSIWAWRSMVWNDSKIEFLGAIPNTHHSWITAINDSGQYAGPSIVVKELFPFNEDYHATRWDGSVAVDLGPGYALGINDIGDVVGYIEIEGGSQAALWSSSNFVNLGTLGGKYSTANSINNSGQIVGRADISTSSPYQHGIGWQ